MAKPISVRTSEETVEILSDPDALFALEAGLAEIERDETITLAELRSELVERRPYGGDPR